MRPLDICAAIGCQRIVSGFGKDNFKTLDDTKRSIAVFNQTYAEAKARGLAFAVHNHWWEYLVVEGQYPYQIMLREMDPGIQLEIDTYWVQTGGVDPVKAIQESGKRATLLHIKDGPANTTEPMQALGTGAIDIPALLKAATYAEWLIVELDRCRERHGRGLREEREVSEDDRLTGRLHVADMHRLGPVSDRARPAVGRWPDRLGFVGGKFAHKTFLDLIRLG